MNEVNQESMNVTETKGIGNFEEESVIRSTEHRREVGKGKD